MKQFLTMFALVFFLCLAACPALEAKAYDFTIDSYHVDMKVTKQNTYRVTEKLKVNFNVRRHGIYRDIPLLNHIERKDGSTDTVMAKLENVSCSDSFSLSRENSEETDYCRLKIGDKNSEIIGEKEYTISFDYVMGNDVLTGNDELYYNIIPTEHTSPIRNITFSIEMPDTFDEKKLGMSYGSYGAELLNGLTYRIEGRTIYGQLDPDITLQNGDSVTVRLLLKEGYFERADTTPWLAYISIAVAAFGALIAFVLWYIYGRDDPVVETVEFYPPNGLNSLELAFAYKGTVDNKDVVSLLVFLAQKGYLRILENGKRDFIIEKVKEYDGINEAERQFFQGLFRKGDSVSKKDLTDSFYKTVNVVKVLVDNNKNKKIIYYASSINKGWILWLLTIVSFVFTLIKPMKDYYFSILAGLGAGVGLAVVACLAYVFLFDENAKILARIITFFTIAVIGFVGFFIFLREPIVYADTWYKTSLILDLILGGVTMFFCSYMSKRTPYGTEILGRIRGFRTFLDTAEKERLEVLVNEEPQYFYDILPYTYVLDLSDKWMKKFEGITVEPPDWYYGSNHSMFDMVMFHHFMTSTMSQATSSMTSTPSSSGGGGFSGGGSGGGGVGSW